MNLIMNIIRAIAILIIAFILADFVFRWGMLKSLSPYFIIFAIIYFFGSMTQMLIRFKSQYRYKSRRDVEGEDESAENIHPPEAGREE